MISATERTTNAVVRGGIGAYTCGAVNACRVLSSCCRYDFTHGSIGIVAWPCRSIVIDACPQLAVCIEQGEIATAYNTGHMEMDRIGSFGEALATQRALPGDASALVDLTGLGVQDLSIATIAAQGVLAA